MSELVGKWEHVNSENLEEFFKTIGLNAVTRKLAMKSSPKITIENDGKKWKIKTKVSSLVTMNTECTEDQEFIEKPPMFGADLKVVMTRENERKLVTVTREIGNESKVITGTRELVGEQMVLTMVSNGVTCVRYFKRIGT